MVWTSARYAYATQDNNPERQALFLRAGRKEIPQEELVQTIKSMPVLDLMLRHVGEALNVHPHNDVVGRHYWRGTAPEGPDYRIPALYEEARERWPEKYVRMPEPSGNVLTHNLWVRDVGIISEHSSPEQELNCLVRPILITRSEPHTVRAIDMVSEQERTYRDPFGLGTAPGAYGLSHRDVLVDRVNNSLAEQLENDVKHSEGIIRRRFANPGTHS